jgi:hypothetical protein
MTNEYLSKNSRKEVSAVFVCDDMVGYFLFLKYYIQIT